MISFHVQIENKFRDLNTFASSDQFRLLQLGNDVGYGELTTDAIQFTGTQKPSVKSQKFDFKIAAPSHSAENRDEHLLEH